MSSAPDIEKEESFQLSPNPATDFISIQTQNDLNSATIEILTIDGRTVQIMNTVRRNRIEIPTDQLPNGVYFLRVTDEEKFLKSERFVISR
jgi:translation elongation factor P/translation initiation factor 5A